MPFGPRDNPWDPESEEKMYACPYCAYTCLTESELETHLRKHHNIKKI